jgi:dihydroxyacetone synthase
VSTFFMFWLYAAPAARMAALQGLRFIGIGTHDSIGIGEDGTSRLSLLFLRSVLRLSSALSGPTHQPVELSAFYRSLPNFQLIRPADAEEVMGAWQLALADENADTPSLFALSRQAVPLLEGSDRNKMTKGAYVVYGQDVEPEVTIVATGSEVSRAIATAKVLTSTNKVRVVSMPSQKHFDAQPLGYRQSVLPTSKSLVVAIEAWSSYGWARYAHASCSMHTFGYSAPQEQLYEKFGFKPEHMASKIDAWVQKWKAQERLPSVGEFEELLLGYAQH